MIASLILSGVFLRPNIVIIFSDDHARQAISAYGSKLIKTPSIDRIAKSGAIFDRFYTSNPICAPSRATLLTGKFSHLNGHIDNASRFNGAQMTFPKLLQAGGYRTAWIGKWHLETEPTGFNHWEILPGQGQYYNPDFLTSSGSHRETGYATDLITDKSVSWLRESAQAPFCLVIGHKAPHRPWQPAIRHLRLFSNKILPEPPSLKMDYPTWDSPAQQAQMRIDRDLKEQSDLLVSTPPARMNDEQRAEWLKAIGPEDAKFKEDSAAGRDPLRLNYQRYIKNYLRCIAAVDESVGRVLNEIKQLGIQDNTVVIYASDQGFFLGEYGFYDKRLFHEPSAGTPLLISAPMMKARNRHVKSVCSNVDLAPTILDFAGLPTPMDMSGRSLKFRLETEQPKGESGFAYGHFYESNDGDHKAPKYVSIVGVTQKLIYYYELDSVEYYDLKSDPQEMRNLAKNQEHRRAIRSMFERLISTQEQAIEDPKVIEATKKAAGRFRP